MPDTAYSAILRRDGDDALRCPRCAARYDDDAIRALHLIRGSFCPRCAGAAGETECHVLEGIVANTHEEVYPAFGVLAAGTRELVLYHLLERLEGKRVRVTIEVLPEGAPDV